MEPAAKPPSLTFDCTIEQSVEAMVAWSQWSPQARRSKRVSMVTYVATVAVVLSVLQWREDKWDPLVVALATVIALLFGVVYWFAYDYSSRRRMRRFIAETAGGHDPMRCEVELHEHHLRSRGGGVEALLDWDTCVEVRDRPEGICFIFRAGPVFVPNQAFADAAARQAFVDQARRLMPTGA